VVPPAPSTGRRGRIAAAKLGLTESSVRTYSKKIFSKTGAKRQAELVRLILKTVSLLGGLHPPQRER